MSELAAVCRLPSPVLRQWLAPDSCGTNPRPLLDFCRCLFYPAVMVEGEQFDGWAQTTPVSELEDRARRLQDMMLDAGLDGVLATQNADIFYLAGVVQQAQLYLPAAGQPLLMVRKHLGRAREASHLPQEQIVGIKSLRELPQLIQGAGAAPHRIGFELDTLPVTIFQAYSTALKELGAELVDASNLFRQVRAIKSSFEIAQIRRAAHNADAGFRAAADNIREGMPEVELAAAVEAATRKAGHSGTLRMRAHGQEMHMGHLLAGDAGWTPSFMNSPTGGWGPGPWAPYGSGSRPIRRNEPVFLDYSGEWGGYIADQTRMLALGSLSAFWTEAYAAMREVADYLVRTVRPGHTSGETFEMANDRATELGYGENFMGPSERESPGQKVPFVGHAVGLELDEWPPLQRGTNVRLEAGMVLALEPKLIFPNRGAIGIEDTYLLTEEGLRSLTFSSRDIVVV